MIASLHRNRSKGFVLAFRLGIVCSILIVAGCASTANLLVPYPQQQQANLDSLKQGSPISFSQGKGLLSTRKGLLGELEAGRINQIQGNVGESIDSYRSISVCVCTCGSSVVVSFGGKGRRWWVGSWEEIGERVVTVTTQIA